MIASLKRAWHRVIQGCKHLRLMAQAAAIGHSHFTGESDQPGDAPIPDAEARYEELWKRDHIAGNAPSNDPYGSVTMATSIKCTPLGPQPAAFASPPLTSNVAP